MRLPYRLAFLALLALPAALRGQAAEFPEPTDETRRHVAARRATGSIRLDGRLDEPDWALAQAAGDWVTSRPAFRPTAAYPSEVRILYDDRHLYIGAFLRDSAMRETMRLPDLRRDFDPRDTDVFAATLGPLGDRRTVFQLQVTPLGSLADVQAFDGGTTSNFSWDTMWQARTTVSDTGWTVEIAVPWTSLRYGPGLTSWDANFVRNIRKKLEWSAWMPYPRQFTSWRLTYGGVIDSLQPPPPRTNVRVRPYVLGQSQRDLAPGAFRGTTGDVGGEVIWAPTANSVVEATVNTDFAQADVDRQVVNLTRFNVFFPERRQFFLENADLLDAGGLRNQYVVQPFFTRRIGLGANGELLPIAGGVRYAYRSGRTSVGALAMRQGRIGGGDDAATFAVARGSAFFATATRIGGTVAARFDDATGTGPARRNVVTAVDALTRIGEEIEASGMVSLSTTDSATGVAATWTASRSTRSVLTSLSGAFVTQEYNPATGFVSRPNVLFTNPQVQLTLEPSWRPKSIVWFRPGMTASLFHTPTTMELQEGVLRADTEVLHRSGGTLVPFVERNLQRPLADIPLLPNVTIPAGTHDYWRYGAALATDQSARVAGSATLSSGTFFDGTLDQAVLGARWSPSPYLALRADWSINRLRSLGTRDTSLVTHLVAPEVRLYANPRLQWSAFYQYNTVQGQGSLNARFSWEFAPLSFLYVVYNDRQPVLQGTAPRANSLIVKLVWLRQL